MSKISVNTVKNFLKANKPQPIEREIQLDEGVMTVQCHLDLTVAERAVFVNRVVNSCYTASGKHIPSYITPMIRATFIQMCTNIPAISVKGESMDDGSSVLDIDAMNRLYELIFTPWVESDSEDGNHLCFYVNGLRSDVYDAIRLKNSLDVANETPYNKLIENASSLVNMIRGKAEAFDAEKVKAYLDNLSETMKKVGNMGLSTAEN